MKKIGMGLAVLLAFVSVSFATPKDQTYSGEIMDSQCAKNGSHDMMLKKEGMEKMIGMPEGKKMCTTNCVKKMDSKYVLFNAASKAVYQLDDQTKPEQFAGQNVKITGTLDKATKTIHVTDITAAS